MPGLLPMKAKSCPDQEFPNHEFGPAQSIRWIRRFEWIVAIALSSVVLCLMVVKIIHAGSLWRDEAESVQSAHMPLAEMGRSVWHTSFPIFFSLSIRAYTGLFGASDISLRCFCLLVSICFPCVVWLGLRAVIDDIPLLLPAVIGLNTNFLVNGTSLRGYGIGTVLVLLAFVLTVRFLRVQNWPNLGAVFVVYLVSMQFLFFNAVLVAAILIATLIILLLRRTVRWTAAFICIAVVCGLSYLPYLLPFLGAPNGKEKALVLPTQFGSLWEYFAKGWAEDSKVAPPIWLIFVFLSAIGALWRLVRIWRNGPTTERDLLLFGILLLPLAMLAYYAFFQVLPRQPDGRYFLALICIMAASIDLLWANFPRDCRLRFARAGLVTLAVVSLPVAIWPTLLPAESNMHQVADMAQSEAGPNDFIVVCPWLYGISFNWYYHGAARWITVPELDDQRVHRYDLVLEKMRSFSPLDEVKEKITTTLQTGNRLWLVGVVELPPAGEQPMRLTPAPDPVSGLSDAAYRKAWSQEIGLFMQQHSEQIIQVVGPGQLVRDREYVMLYACEGWKN